MLLEIYAEIYAMLCSRFKLPGFLLEPRHDEIEYNAWTLPLSVTSSEPIDVPFRSVNKRAVESEANKHQHISFGEELPSTESDGVCGGVKGLERD